MGGGRIFPSRVNCCIYVVNHDPDFSFSGLVCLLISNFLSNREHRLLIQYLEVRFYSTDFRLASNASIQCVLYTEYLSSVFPNLNID
jgi:hypothetical protein